MNIKNIINEEINNFSSYENTVNNYSIDNDFNLYLNDKKIYSPDSKNDLIYYLKKNKPDLINTLNLNNQINNPSHTDDSFINTNPIILYRGHGYNEGNNYYSPSKNFALQFTKSGDENELTKIKVKPSRIYKHNPLPKGYGPDDPNFNIAINIAKKMNLNAIWVDEGENEPNSVYKINSEKSF